MATKKNSSSTKKTTTKSVTKPVEELFFLVAILHLRYYIII